MSGDQIPKEHAEELGECFAAYAPGLFGYACALTQGDHALADDLVQATFMAAARQWPTMRCLHDAQRLRWLHTTVGNLAISAFRRNEAFGDRVPRLEEVFRPRPADTHAEAVSGIALQQCWRAIQALPPQQHAVAVMRWLFAMTNHQIAAALGIADGTVSAHLSAVRGKLKTALGPYDLRQRGQAIVMTTAGNNTASTREDELLAYVYQQAIGAQAAQYAAAWDADAGLARFTGWLQDHATAGPEPGADQMVARLYSLHYRPLVRLATLLVRDAATAEEVVQDAFGAVHGGWHRLGNPEKALAYLRQAVVNRSRSVLRHRAVPGDHPQQVLPDTPDAGHGALGLLEQPATRAALAGLPDRQREAIVLRYYAGLPEGEIAAAMGISRGAVNSHTVRGLSALRAALEQAGSQPARPRDSDDAGPSHD